MKVVRKRYLDELSARKHTGLVKILTGIRRCGKSFLLGVLFKEHLVAEGVRPDHIIEVPLDEDAFVGMRDAQSLAAYIKSHLVLDGDWNYVFVDEVQLAKKVLPEGVDPNRFAPEDRDDLYVTFYDTLNTLRKMDHVDVYVTGSNSKTLSSDIDTNFADRGCQIQLHPFSFAEYCEAMQPTDVQAAFAHYLIWGGMPLAVAENDDDVRARYLQGLCSEVYVNDIRKRHRLRDDVVIERLVDVMASAIGSLSNPHRMVSTLASVMKVKTNDHTIKAYIDYLEDAFLFSEAKRWDVKGNAYFDYPVKYYAEDPGLRNARLGFRDVEPSHMMENVIYNELRARGCLVDVGVVELVSRETGKPVPRQHEIDFVVNRANGKAYIQSAWKIPTDEKREQELKPLRRSGDFFAKIVVTDGCQPPLKDRDGIIHVGVIPFLRDESILDNVLGLK